MWLQIVSAVTAALDELPKEEELKEKAASSTAEEKFSSLDFFSNFFERSLNKTLNILAEMQS